MTDVVPGPPEVLDVAPETPATGRRRPWWWRVATPTAFLLAGGLFVISSLSSDGTDLRASRFDNLSSLVNAESKHVDAQKSRAASLEAEVARLSSNVNDKVVQRIQGRIDNLQGPAGLEAVHGPGLTVTLTDAPDDIIDQVAALEDNQAVKNLLVHQQDIQAVANAMWAGGAEAMTIQGQRVISTTGIKCVGNVVILHGIPYSPPYRISAIGDATRMAATLDASPYIGFYKEVVERYQLGYAQEVEADLEMPAYPSLPTLTYAKVAGRGDNAAR